MLRPTWRVGIHERLGVGEAAETGALWIHAASVGEILAAARLVDRLRRDGHRVIASTVTLTGREAMRRARPQVPCRLAPLDHPWCVDAALERMRPRALVLIETELWPSWIAAAARRGVPVVLVSGRVSDRSYPRYRRLGRLLLPTLRRLAAVGARTGVDAERFRSLGVDPRHLSVTGDLKLEIDAAPPSPAADLDRALGGAPLFVAGSTHPGEETAALAALAEVERGGARATLVLAPRHPERAEEVARLVRAQGRTPRLRTALGPGPLRDGDVLVLDTLGELPALYGRADACFVGGTLAPVGGHNVLEPVFAGRPVLYGRHTANVRHAVEILEPCGAGRAVADAAELGGAVLEWLRHPESARARGKEGRRVLHGHRGSAARSAALIEAALAAHPTAR